MSAGLIVSYAAAIAGLAGQMGDLITTEIAFGRGDVEGNPAISSWPHWALAVMKVGAGIAPLVFVLTLPSALTFLGFSAGVGAAIVGFMQTYKNYKFLKG